MADLASLVRAGAIVPLGAPLPEGERTGSVSARRYLHPALPGRPLVRLVPDPIAAGIDAEMDVLGFAPPTVSAPLGNQRYRALGFPGWALVNDPKHARFALDVMKDFKKAAARAKSKPGHARDAFVEIGDRLARSVPHFLPSFWEEAGRAFLAEDASSFAAQCFEKARTAEREHALAVDEDLRSSVYLEFALAGAVAAKSFSGYAKELEKSYGAPAAYARFRELAVRRTLGGLPPWAGMAKDLRALAKAAKLDLAAEDAKVVAELLEAPTIARAPGDFWSTYRAAIVALARRDEKARQRVRHLFPKPSSGAQGFVDEWLAVLEECDALSALEADSGEEPSGAAATFCKALLEFVEGARKGLPYLDRLAARIRADGVPLVVDRKHRWHTVLDLHVVEHALSLELPVADPKSAFVLEKDLVDPVRIAADPRFAPLLVTAVAAVIGQAAFEEEAAGKGGFATARSAWLRQRIETLERAALPELGWVLTELEQRTGPRIWKENPEDYARLGAVSVARALATSLRGGLLAELTWPVFEAATKEMGTYVVSGAFPYPVLFDNRLRAVVLTADRKVLDHSLHLPKNVAAQQAVFVDGQLCVFHWDPEAGGSRCYWSGNPGAGQAAESMPYHHGTDLMAQADVAGGGVTLGGRVVHAGDPGVPATSRVVFDGTTYWTFQWHEGAQRLVELDPLTGKLGRPSWPSFARAASERSDGKRLTDVALAALPAVLDDTPLGHKDGFVGYHVRSDGKTYEFTGIDGRTRTGSYPMEGLVVFPGGDSAPRSLAGARRYQPSGYHAGIDLRDPDGVLLGALGSERWDHHPFRSVPPLSCWHFLRPRDPAGSVALRAVDLATARRLLEARATHTGEHGAEEAVRAVLPAVTDPALVTAIGLQVDVAVKLGEALAKLHTARGAEAPVRDQGALSAQEIAAALGPLLGVTWAGGAFSPELAAAGEALAFQPPPSFVGGRLPWPYLLGRLGGLAVWAQSVGLSAEQRATVIRLLRAFRGQPSLTTDLEHLRVYKARLAAESPLLGAPGSAAAVQVGASHAYFATTVEDGVRLVVERAKGAFELPPHATLVEEESRASDETALVDAFLAAEVPVRVSAEAIARLAEETGLTRAEAALVFGGVCRLGTYEADFLGKETREALGLKVAEAKVARESLKGVGARQWLRVFGAAGQGTDVAELGDPDARARRLAAAWNEVVGRRVALREELVLACEKELDPPSRTTDLLAALLAPENARLLTVKEVPFEEYFAWQAPDDRLSPQLLTSCCLLLPWLFATLPVGDPYRDAVPAFLSTLHQRLAEPSLLLPLAAIHVEEKLAGQNRALFESVDGAPSTRVVDRNNNTAPCREGEALVAVLQRKDTYLQALFRPARLPVDDAVAWRFATASYSAQALPAVRLLRSPGFAAMVARTKDTPVPKGRYEADPSVSAPALVAAVVAERKLSPTAATLYLQLLTLAEPTQRSVILWNDWKPPVYKQAAAELVARKLVVEGKRERAGREIFLPGAWEKGQGKALPMERWKQPLYALDKGVLPRPVPLRPLHELFAVALERVRSGDVPKLEEV